MEKPVTNMLDMALRRIKEMVDVNMIIGDQINTPDGTTIIPVSKLSMGLGGGGGEYGNKNSNSPNTNFGGGIGSGVNITPVLFLVVSGGNVRVINVESSGVNPFDKIAEVMPIVVDKVGSFLEKRRSKKAEKESEAGEPADHTDGGDTALPEAPAE